MNVDNIVASGCSFTQDGISGVLPLNGVGGNSFLDYPNDNIVGNLPKSWAGIVAKHLAVKSIVNTAASSHGNILIANSLLTLLTSFKYPIKNTLVLFNITEPTRLDIPCEFDNLDKSEYIPWTRNIIPFSYLSRTSTSIKNLEQRLGPDAVSYLTSNTILFLLNFLKNNDYKFIFLTMSDYSNDPHLGHIIEKFNQHFLMLDNFKGMKEYCVHKNLTVSKSDCHPNIIGHQVIAERVLQQLSNSRVE